MLKERLAEDLKKALKDRNPTAVSILRMVLASLHNKEIERKKSLADDEVLSILSSEQKKHKDSIEQFKSGNRADLVSKEEAELRIIEAYLPAALNEDELRVLVREAIAAVGARGKGDFGKVMKEIMARARGRAEGALVSKIVTEEINKT
ncbi:MAG: GatB/YqeY domain-containing protein [Candidatus Doudnabacteria bacterium]|nr:GatB/YqeY domain-containing protein [bacterium]MDZ4244034.1 GatB/YqeY domain-containing protein [Candidatus Doudnabacteria bacterium]